MLVNGREWIPPDLRPQGPRLISDRAMRQHETEIRAAEQTGRLYALVVIGVFVFLFAGGVFAVGNLAGWWR
jgi:hypothetical protein